MRTLVAALFCFLLIGQCEAVTYDPAVGRCVGNDEDWVIRRVIDDLDFMDQALPNVPPEEQRYLDAEYARFERSLKDEAANGDTANTRSRSVIDTIAARPYFALWNFRKTIEPARKDAKAILSRDGRTTYRGNGEAEKLERFSKALYSINGFFMASSDFMNKMHGNELTAAQIQRLSSDKMLMGVELGQFISCKLARVMGPQSLP